MGGPLLLLGLARGPKVSVYEGCATNAVSSNAFGERFASELEVCGAGALLPASLYQLSASHILERPLHVDARSSKLCGEPRHGRLLNDRAAATARRDAARGGEPKRGRT
jgi:hypothetical protein